MAESLNIAWHQWNGDSYAPGEAAGIKRGRRGNSACIWRPGHDGNDPVLKTQAHVAKDREVAEPLVLQGEDWQCQRGQNEEQGQCSRGVMAIPPVGARTNDRRAT